MRSNTNIKDILSRGEVHLSLFKGYSERNKPFHVFIVLRGDNFNKIEAATGQFELENYGTILYSNDGHEVPDYIITAVTDGFTQRYLPEGA